MKRFAIQFLSAFFACTSFSTAADAAQETRLAIQAMHCAGFLTVFAQAHEADAERGRRLAKAQAIFIDVYLKELRLNNLENAHELVSVRRSEVIGELQADWGVRAPELREQGVICGAWAEGFLAQGHQYQYVPVYPKVVPSQIRTMYQEIFDWVRLP